MKTNTGQSSSDYGRIALTGAGNCWLLVAAALAGVGLYKGINLILLLAYFLVVLLAINWFLVWRTLRSVYVRIDRINDSFAGTSRRCSCLVSLERGQCVRGLQVALTVVQQTCKWYIPVLELGQELLLTRKVELGQRGLFSQGKLTIRTSFPFGLVESIRQFNDPRPLSIYPQRGEMDLSRLLRRIGQDGTARGIHRTAVRQLTVGTDIHGLRPFRPGDSPRWIHWRTTARVGELMVREFDRASGPSLTVIVAPAASEGEFEAGLQLAATLVWDWSRQQDGRLRIWIAPKLHWETWELDHRRRADDFLRRLALAEFSGSTALPLPTELPTRGAVVYISNRPNSSAERPWGLTTEWINPNEPSPAYRPPLA